jgi:hypothetical protein
MADVTNNSQRLIWMGNVMCIPGQTTTVDDAWTTQARYVELEAKGDVTTGAPPPPLRDVPERVIPPAPVAAAPARPAVATPTPPASAQQASRATPPPQATKAS